MLQDALTELAPGTRAGLKVTGAPCNLVETWASYVLQIALPGVDPESLDVQVVARQVRVQGKYAVPAVENGTFIWQGIALGTFTESFTMPAEVDGDRAKAQYQHGILTIYMPKVAYVKGSSINVETLP